MQYEEGGIAPESPVKFRIQQVEEQSTVCDVTVKMGHWEKKFHQCVLVVSPFFEHALKDNYLEKQKAKIEMIVGTPATVEMAIMFLYGTIPKITQENIEHILNLAEFLLIPNLKSACISWLRAVMITEENCMNLLQISSIYDFEIPSCNEYLMGHMSEMLRLSQTINLSKDSIEYLFSDKKLSYVLMDEKVIFLIRWANGQPAKRKHHLKELFEIIDFHEVSKAVLEELKNNQNVCGEIDLENIRSYVANEIPHKHRVLIMKAGNRDGTLCCLDLEREKWFRLKPEVAQIGRTHNIALNYRDISGARNVSSEIYYTKRTRHQTNVFILNLEKDFCKNYHLVREDNSNDLREIGGVCIVGDICIGYAHGMVKTNKRAYRETVKRLKYPNGCNPLALVRSCRRSMDIATLYIGDIKDEAIKMSPLLTFKNDKISNICINDMLTVAVIFRTRKAVSLFDLVDYKIQTVQLETKYKDRLVQSADGFIIYNTKRCICLIRTTGPSLSCKYRIKEISLENHGIFHEKYIFRGKTWYHYYRVRNEVHYRFESASHNDMISNGSVDEVAWKKLPLPKEETRCNSSTITDFFQICLPRNKLRCDIECPHCKLKPEGRFRGQSSVESVDMYDTDSEDSSDDNYYGFLDEDYGFYVDSD